MCYKNKMKGNNANDLNQEQMIKHKSKQMNKWSKTKSEKHVNEQVTEVSFL